MKMLVNRIPVSDNHPFDLVDLKGHMRVDGNEEDRAITAIGWTAAAELENFAQIALLRQTIRVVVFDPPVQGGVMLPIGPVLEGTTATVTVDVQPFTGFYLDAGNRPYLRWHPDFHDLPHPSRITIEYEAGFGSTAADVPPDLAQALLDQAALHYDGRSPMDARHLTTSPHMARIGARYRGVSL